MAEIKKPLLCRLGAHFYRYYYPDPDEVPSGWTVKLGLKCCRCGWFKVILAEWVDDEPDPPKKKFTVVK